MNSKKQPVIFLGSSTEGLDIARTVEDLLHKDARVRLWTSGVFEPGTYPLEALLSEVDNTDYAAFVLGPDDITVSRKAESPAPRDNVIFEAGFFMGRLGRLRTFLLYDEEHDTRLPSDLKGLTLVPFSHRRYLENPHAALGPAANQIRRALSHRTRFEEIEFLKAYLKFIDPHVSLTDTYCSMLSKNIEQIRRDVAELESKGDWETLVQVKVRLREYFEYSGAYRYGADCGIRFANALTELGDHHEAAWTRVKQVAYLKILAGDHAEGRKELFAILQAHNEGQSDRSNSTLRFYCNRYLGISYQREELPGNLAEALKYFDQAGSCLAELSQEDPTRRELEARLLANYGNLALETRDFRSAVDFYTSSLGLFSELDDSEHIGIAHRQIGQALIAGGSDLAAANMHLDVAEGLFLELGYVELQGRLAEQRALLNETLARHASHAVAKKHHVGVALENANRAKRLYRQIDSQRRLGAIESILGSLRREFPDVVVPSALAADAG